MGEPIKNNNDAQESLGPGKTSVMSFPGETKVTNKKQKADEYRAYLEQQIEQTKMKKNNSRENYSNFQDNRLPRLPGSIQLPVNDRSNLLQPIENNSPGTNKTSLMPFPGERRESNKKQKADEYRAYLEQQIEQTKIKKNISRENYANFRESGFMS